MVNPPPLMSVKDILIKRLTRGGLDAFITGKPSSGKTSLLLYLAALMCDSEICIFRGMKYGQEFRFPKSLKIIAYKCKPIFYNTKGEPIQEIMDKITYVGEMGMVGDDFDEILKACELGKLNVLYFPFKNERRYWLKFSEFLIERFHSRYASIWVALFIDEVEDILPSPEAGSARAVKEFTNEVKEFRKTLVSFYSASQQFFDVHWGLLGKLRVMIYLKGAYVPKREKRVRQKAVDNLPIGRGIISGDFFGYFEFPNCELEQMVIVRQ